MVFIFPLPENFSEIYSADYFFGAKKGFGYVNYDDDKLAMSKTLVTYLEKIKDFSSGNKLLDIGAATGYFLQLAEKAGFEGSGIEISEYAAEIARRRGLKVVTGTLEKSDFKPEFFDAVTLWDVLEHLINPDFDFRVIYKILKPGGVVAINTIDTGSFAAKILGKRWYKFIPPEHVIYFNQNNLCFLLSKIGFEVVYAGKIRKKFALQYLFNMLARWQNIFIWRWAADLLAGTRLGSISLPVDFRDDFFIIAKKS